MTLFRVNSKNFCCSLFFIFELFMSEKKLKFIIVNLICVCFILAGSVFAQSTVNLQIKTQSPDIIIPDDFSGLSFEMGSLRSGNGGTNGYMFDDTTTWPIPQHKQIFHLFKELGIRNIRVGGGSVDMNIVPSNTDIDAFFRFVKEINASIIYSVRLLNGNITDDTNIVKYVWGNYKQYIDCFAIGNEPDFHSYHTVDPQIYETSPGVPGTAYPSYLNKWRSFAAAITTAVPLVKFGGPDTGSNYPIPGGSNTSYNGKTWTLNFWNDEKNSGIFKTIFFHNYVGGGAPSIASGIGVRQMIDQMLSTTWVSSYYPDLYNASCAPLVAEGFPYRLTESNSFSGYRAGGSNSFATALFALDYMHWWAAHGATGVNFHNKQWVGNGPIYLDGNGNFQTYPIGYGIKAFDLGGHGRSDSLTITNPDTLNLTAYAVADTNYLYVTIINKEHGNTARDANIIITADGLSDSAAVMYLTSPNGVADTTGVTLGGFPITNSGWAGTWSPIDSISTSGYYVKVPASSAAIVKIKDTITSVSDKPGLPGSFTLYQNYPNTFNPTTNIGFSVPSGRDLTQSGQISSASGGGFVSLKVYDILGREVATLVNENKQPGIYNVKFDANNLASGIYFYQLRANNFVATKKMVLLR